MAKTFLDSNVIVYANDSRYPDKQSTAIEVVGAHLRSGEGVISTQVMQEYPAVALGKLAQPPEVIIRQLLPLEALEIVAIQSGLLGHLSQPVARPVDLQHVPVARLVPVQERPDLDVAEAVAQLRQFRQGRTLGALSIRKMIEEGRRC